MCTGPKFYRLHSIASSTPHTSLHYVTKWENYLGLQLDAKDWSDIWTPNKSASQNVVALEANYKFPMHLVPNP